MKTILKGLYELTESLVFAGAIFVVCYLFFFQVSEVHGASSYPTLQENDRLIVDKISYRFANPQRGDFVVIYSPYDRNIDFVKRIIGLPNEEIKISNCKVFINNEILDESTYFTGCTTGNIDLLIPNDYYFVMGDNRPGSSDSRTFGPIKKEDIIDKVLWHFKLPL